MHTRPYAQDGNRLYQPCEKEKHGKIPLPLVRQILETLQETTLFALLDEKRRWVFDPVGAWPDEVTGRINKGAPFLAFLYVFATCCCFSPELIPVCLHEKHPENAE